MLQNNNFLFLQLSDQKQVSGWTSRDHITAPVIYDVTQDKYVGVFNNNTLKTWEEDSTNLDKLKKFKVLYSFYLIYGDIGTVYNIY